MRIMDWSSDVCSSDLVFGVAAEQGVQRQQAGQEHRHPEYAGRDLCQRSWFVAQCKGEQHDYEEGEQGGLQGVAAAAPEEAEVADDQRLGGRPDHRRSEEHTSELQSLMRISYAVFCLQKKNIKQSMKQ